MKQIKCLLVSLLFFMISLAARAEEEVLILFDSSVSMMENLNKEPKYVQAVNAAKKVLSETNPAKKIGMRIIGMQLNENLISYLTNPGRLCSATEIVNPIKSNNIRSISDSLDLIMPLGTTPLTYSLKTAIENDFSQTAYPKHIILITDGYESCNQDPCKYIREITKYRKDIKIDIISINVSGDDFSRLKCLADATFGSVKTVKTSGEIENSFSTFIPGNKSYSNSKFFNQENNEIKYKNYLFETYK